MRNIKVLTEYPDKLHLVKGKEESEIRIKIKISEEDFELLQKFLN